MLKCSQKMILIVPLFRAVPPRPRAAYLRTHFLCSRKNTSKPCHMWLGEIIRYEKSMRIFALKICSVFLVKIRVDADKKHTLYKSVGTGRTKWRKTILPRHNFIFNILVTCLFDKNKMLVACHNNTRLSIYHMNNRRIEMLRTDFRLLDGSIRNSYRL